MNAYEIVRRVCVRSGLGSPSVAVGSTDEKIQQMLELLNEEGQELSAEYGWQALTFEGSFTTVATESQGLLEGEIVPSGSRLRYIVGDTLFDREGLVPIYGPKRASQWQEQKSLNIVGPWPQFRFRSGELLLDPLPTAGNEIFFEYVSKNWVMSEADVPGEEITADTDQFRLDSDLLLLGLRWRWKKEKGLAYSQEFDSYTRRVQDAKARDKAPSTIFLDDTEDAHIAGIVVPVGSWAV